MRNQLLNSAKIIILAIIISFGLSYAIAWTAPTAIPPAGNVSAPINTSATGQTKVGGITVGSLNAGSGNIGTTGFLSGVLLTSSITFTDGKVQTTATNGGSHGKQRFLTSGNFVVPPGVTEVWVTLSAGGGGGAGASYFTINPPGSPGGNSGLIKNRFSFPTYPVIAYGGAGGTYISGGAGGVVGGGIDPNFGVVGGAGTRLAAGSVCLGAGGGNIFGGGGALGMPGNGYGSGGGSHNAPTVCGGGGGAGGAIIAQKIAVSVNDDLYALVGAGGAAGDAGHPTYRAARGAPGFVLIEW